MIEIRPTNEKCYTTRSTCRVCGSSILEPMFSLGDQIVSDFVTEDKIHTGHKVPIDIERCAQCTLVQAKHTAPQDFLYTRQYWYRSGVTATMRNALADIVSSAKQHVDLYPGDVVLDIGSNDGTLLRNYPENLIRVGCEPADNLATEENYKGLELIPDFWSETNYMLCAPGVTRGAGIYTIPKSKIITAIGMFYDMEEPSDFVRDVAKVLHPEGIFVAQLMCLKQMLQIGDVGNLAHEHLEFYTLRSLNYLFNKHGLVIYDIEENNVNGGSYRLYACHAHSEILKQQENEARDRVVNAHIAEESACSRRNILRFAENLEENRKMLKGFINAQIEDGKKVHILGASTKGNVIAQWLDLNPDLIYCASERSPEKHGLFMVGTGIPIVSEDVSRHLNPDFYLVLPFAFLGEIMEREKDWHVNDRKFIVPLPRMRIV